MKKILLAILLIASYNYCPAQVPRFQVNIGLVNGTSKFRENWHSRSERKIMPQSNKSFYSGITINPIPKNNHYQVDLEFMKQWYDESLGYYTNPSNVTYYNNINFKFNFAQINIKRNFRIHDNFYFVMGSSNNLLLTATEKQFVDGNIYVIKQSIFSKDGLLNIHNLKWFLPGIFLGTSFKLTKFDVNISGNLPIQNLYQQNQFTKFYLSNINAGFSFKIGKLKSKKETKV